MVVLETEPTALDNRVLSLYYTKDLSVGNLPVVVFHGPSTTTNSTLNSSRIQAHIFSIAGYQSFPRLTISPTSSLYSAVHHLPEEDQGDEICRGLAISLLKYFNEIPLQVKECIQNTIVGSQPDELLFDETHAARLASQMQCVENSAPVIAHIITAFSSKSISWTDIDLILPSDSLTKLEESLQPHDSITTAGHAFDTSVIDYGKFTELVELFGSPSFIPTSRLRRAPSRPTGGKKQLALSDEQIEALKLDLLEVLETERSYVFKINELASVIAPRLTEDTAEVSLQDREAVQRLFPPCLSHIVDANAKFLDQLEELIQHDENIGNAQETADPLLFAKLLLEAIPEFRQPYIEYIRASNAFVTILNGLAKDTTSAYAQKLQQIGEQRLRSLLIEPIQRLPRYALLADSMVKRLPVNHPAVSKLLKAKDLIGEILDAEEADVDHNSKILKRLRYLISDWPVELNPGRLITVADVSELSPPYAYNPRVNDESQGLILLFPDNVVVLRKTAKNTLSARGLMAEIDRPSIESISTVHHQVLNHVHTFRLSETLFTETDDGRLICLNSITKTISKDLSGNDAHSPSTQVYALQGAYEGKAGKWSEEVARARIEWRFPEDVREKNTWALRTTSPDKQNLGIVSAITVSDINTYSEDRQPPHKQIQVIVQDGTAHHVQDGNFNENEVTAKITLTGHSMYRLEFWRLGHSISVDNIHAEDFTSTFRRRLNNVQRLLYQPTSELTAHMHVAANKRIVETIRPNLPIQLDTRSIKFRPISPVKVLSSFLGGIRDQAVLSKPPKLERSGSKQSLRSLKDMKPGLGLGFQNVFEPAKAPPIAKLTSDTMDGAFVQLEKTLNTYIVALHSRCGNVVGKVIRNRMQADDLMVNELYNVLLEDPTQYQATAEVSVDVLFAAFENFLNHAWRHKMGRLLPEPILHKLEHIFHTQSPSQLGPSFTSLLREMTPQNQRAFSALIKLVFDLLDASGNDGDRGAITAAFAEALFPADDSQKYISLLDRMVDNIDVLFDDVVIPEEKQTPQFNSMGRRIKATTPGSVSSTTSSFKKRFGFGKASRENSQAEPESRVGQILRNLSKKAGGEIRSQPSSLSKSFLTRSKSIDDDSRRPIFPRPGSASAKDMLDPSSFKSSLATAAVSDVVPPLVSAASYQVSVPKKKRRSSLSDITALRNGANPDFSSLMKLKVLETATDSIHSSQEAQTLPKSPMPIKLPHIEKTPTSQIDKPSKIPSPMPAQKLSTLSSHKKENVPPTSPPERNSSIPRAAYASPSLGISKRRNLDPSQIPLLKPGATSPPQIGTKRSILSPPVTASPRRKVSGSPQRVTSSGLHRVSGTSPQRKISSNQRLRMQSPQKLRERLEREKKAVDQATSSLHSGLGQIHEGSTDAQSPEDIQTRIIALENKFNKTLGDLAKQNAAIQKDVESSLIVSEKKAKSLDDVYREANAENELLYEKFNGELMRVLDAVKSGAGLQEMRNKLREAQDEASRLRKENQRLKRENLGLKSQLR